MHLEFDDFVVGDQRHVYRRVSAARSRTWVPWVMVAPSPGRGKGVFALRDFAPGEIIGKYVGRILGHTTNRGARRQTNLLEATGRSTMLITLFDQWFVDGAQPLQSNREQQHLFGQVVLPNQEANWPGMFAHYINSYVETNQLPNVEITWEAWVRVTRHVARGQELFQDYGSSYYQEMRNRGTHKLPFNLTNEDRLPPKRKRIYKRSNYA